MTQLNTDKLVEENVGAGLLTDGDEPLFSEGFVGRGVSETTYLNLHVENVKMRIKSSGTKVKSVKNDMIRVWNDQTDTTYTREQFTEWLVDLLTSEVSGDVEIPELTLCGYSEGIEDAVFTITCDSVEGARYALSYLNAETVAAHTELDFYSFVQFLPTRMHRIFATLDTMSIQAGSIRIESDDEITHEVIAFDGNVLLFDHTKKKTSHKPISVIEMVNFLLDRRSAGATITIQPCAETRLAYPDHEANVIMVSYDGKTRPFTTPGQFVKFVRETLNQSFDRTMSDGLKLLDEYQGAIRGAAESIREIGAGLIDNLDSLLPDFDAIEEAFEEEEELEEETEDEFEDAPMDEDEDEELDDKDFEDEFEDELEEEETEEEEDDFEEVEEELEEETEEEEFEEPIVEVKPVAKAATKPKKKVKTEA